MEKSSENNVISLLDAKQLFSDVNHDTLAQIYDYWLNKRLSLVCSFTPTVSHQLLLTPRRGQAFSQMVKIYVANSECCCKRENSGVSQNTGLNTWRILCRFLAICSKADHEMWRATRDRTISPPGAYDWILCVHFLPCTAVLTCMVWNMMRRLLFSRTCTYSSQECR